MSRNGGMKPVYVGDVGNTHYVGRPKTIKQPPKLDYGSMSFRELFNMAIECGFDVRDLIGVKSCDDHNGMIFLGGKEMPQGMNLAEHCVYCNNCWRFFRQRSL